MLLTVSIPTLNGAKFIEETLRSAWGEVRFVEEASILVVDNASTDETAVICQRLLDEGLCFEYVNKAETESADANHLSAVALADSEYVWILADDDVLVPGSVRKVCDLLLRHRPNVAVINFEAVDQYLQILRTTELHSADRKVLENSTSKNQNWEAGPRAFFSIGLEKIGVLSANCVLRDAYVLENTTTAREVPAGFLFIYLVSSLMLTGTTLYVGEPLIQFRQYPKRWEGTELSDPLRIDYVVTPYVLRILARRGYRKKDIRRLIFERSTTLAWHLAQAKKKPGTRLSFSMAKEVTMANWPNLLIPIQLTLWVLPSNLFTHLEKAYSSKFAESLRYWKNKWRARDRDS